MSDKTIEETGAHILEVINTLRHLDLESADWDYILRLVSEIQFPITQSTIIPKTVISRCRSGQGYMTWQEMTYKPVLYCQTAQRASLPNETVFYGIISDNTLDSSGARAIGISECSKLASEGLESYGTNKR